MSRARLAEVVQWVLIAMGTVSLFAVRHKISGDGQVRFEALEQLLTNGRLAAARFSMVGPLFAGPLYLIGRAFGATRTITSLYNPLLFVCLIVIVYRDLNRELDAAVRRMLLLFLVMASMFPQHVQHFYGEVFTTFAISVGVLLLSRGRSAIGWLLILLGAVNTPAALLGVAAIAVSHARLTRRWSPLLAPLVAFALVRLEFFIVRGSFNASGYVLDHGFPSALPYSGLPNFSYPLFFGVLAIVLSFGKGLVFFTPGLFLPLPASAPARVRWIHYTLVAYVAGLILVYAKWWAWNGGWFWGPRFFLAASVPASLALALNLCEWRRAGQIRRVVLAIAVPLSFWVGVNGMVFQNAGLDVCRENNYALDAFCSFVPEMSILWHPFVDGAASHPPTERIACWAAACVWLLTAIWIGRQLYREVLSNAIRKALAWRQWW